MSTNAPDKLDELLQQLGAEIPPPTFTDEEMAGLDAEIQQLLDAVPLPSLDAL